MRDTAMWAFWRRVWYGSGFMLFWLGVAALIFMLYFYEAPQCFDGRMNGDETGIDCGGSCVRICSSDVIPPNIRWVQSFKVRDGQYNAVAYIENMNQAAGTQALPYTFSLYDSEGLIAERSGMSVLPPDSIYPVFEGPIQTNGRVPTNTFIDIGEPEIWLPVTQGRGQFPIVNRTLTNADSKPRLEVQLSNSALVEARDVEVVATIFDVRGNALTSSRTFVEQFSPRATQDIVFTWPEPIAKTMRSCEVPTDVVLAIDLSGSMNNDQANPPEPITSVLSAAAAFVDRLDNEEDQVGIVTFATEAEVYTTLTSDSARVQEMIQALNIAPGEETGSTNTGDAFVRVLEELDSPRHNASARKVAVILTDGLATAPDEEPEEYARTQAEALKDAEVEVYAIGLGNAVNMDFVRSVATDSSYAYQALSRAQVDQIYRDITGAICEDGAAIIDVIPKTGTNFTPLR